jgi:hypothetical protein
MKKDTGRLHLDIEMYEKLFSDINNINEQSDKKIIQIMDEEIAKAGYNKNDGAQAYEINGIETWSKMYLRQAIKADDMYKYTHRLDLNLSGSGMSERAKNVIKTIVTNHEILDFLSEAKISEKRLVDLSKTINDKSCSIVTAIESKDYDVEADCCPTYWSLLRRFI